MNLFDLSLKLNGFPLSKAKASLASIQDQNNEAFEAYIDRQKKAILAYHLKNNSFYQALAAKHNVDNWTDLPVLKKSHLQKPLEQRLSQGFSTKNVYINKTSGSSGDPFIFAKDKFCHAMTWAIIQDRFGWYGLDFNSSRQARFYGIPLDKKNYLKERFKDSLSKRYRFSVFDLSDAAFENYLLKFRSVPFDYINGYTSSVVQFAKFLERRDLCLKAICPSLKVCMVTSEMLFALDRQLMETQFGVPVVNEYGASELDLIAFENPSGHWQITNETLVVEILDENDQILEAGKEGRVVITSLFNKAHPFIRYDIGDIGVISKEGTVEKPILKSLTGRTNDLVHLPSGKKAAGLTFYYVTKSIIENDGNVKEFIIRQKTIKLFVIEYISQRELTTTEKEKINLKIKTYLEDGLLINFERKHTLKRTKSGKLKQFISEIVLDT